MVVPKTVHYFKIKKYYANNALSLFSAYCQVSYLHSVTENFMASRKNVFKKPIMVLFCYVIGVLCQLFAVVENFNENFKHVALKIS